MAVDIKSIFLGVRIVNEPDKQSVHRADRIASVRLVCCSVKTLLSRPRMFYATCSGLSKN